jgi:hypothetical protein
MRFAKYSTHGGSPRCPDRVRFPLVGAVIPAISGKTQSEMIAFRGGLQSLRAMTKMTTYRGSHAALGIG